MFNWLKCLFKSSPEEMLIEKIRNSNTLKWIGRTVEMNTVPEPCYSFNGYFYVNMRGYNFSVHKTERGSICKTISGTTGKITTSYSLCLYPINEPLNTVYISDEDTKKVIELYNDGVEHFKELDMPRWERERLEMKRKIEDLLKEFTQNEDADTETN